MITKTN